jgi:hypothetical protein
MTTTNTDSGTFNRQKRRQTMTRKPICLHERARFHSVQRLGSGPAVELWHCPTCQSTVAVDSIRRHVGRVAAA